MRDIETVNKEYRERIYSNWKVLGTRMPSMEQYAKLLFTKEPVK